jgi:hypothetical protein
MAVPWRSLRSSKARKVTALGDRDVSAGLESAHAAVEELSAGIAATEGELDQMVQRILAGKSPVDGKS